MAAVFTLKAITGPALKKLKELEKKSKQAHSNAIRNTGRDAKRRMVSSVRQNKNPATKSPLAKMSELQRLTRGKPYGGTWSNRGVVAFRKDGNGVLEGRVFYPGRLAKYFLKWQNGGFRVDSQVAAIILARRFLKLGKAPDVYSSMNDGFLRYMYHLASQESIKPNWHEESPPQQPMQPQREIIGDDFTKFLSLKLERETDRQFKRLFK